MSSSYGPSSSGLSSGTPRDAKNYLLGISVPSGRSFTLNYSPRGNVWVSKLHVLFLHTNRCSVTWLYFNTLRLVGFFYSASICIPAFLSVWYIHIGVFSLFGPSVSQRQGVILLYFKVSKGRCWVLSTRIMNCTSLEVLYCYSQQRDYWKVIRCWYSKGLLFLQV